MDFILTAVALVIYGIVVTLVILAFMEGEDE